MIDPTSQVNQLQGDIAIVGMACIFPQAPDLKTYWRNIISKVDAIGDPPAGSLVNLVHDPSSSATNRIYCSRGGYLTDIPPFNPSDFGVMPVAIDGAEPEHFIALKVAHDALLDAGFPDRNFNREKTEVLLGRGTFVNRGYMTAMQHSVVVDQTIRILKELHPHYSEETLAALKSALMKQLPPFTPETAPGLCHNVMAGLIANRLNLQGRNLVLDAACATCLLALEIGMDDLLQGKCDAALVGGVQISTHAPIHMIFTQLGALTHQPHLKPFDKDADGTMLGEGVGMVVLKRLRDAVRDGHRIYAVIKGIGSSSDGRGSGLLAPRLEGEELAVRRAYERARVDPTTIELVEAHGTGIPLGDVTEIKALTKVFGRRTSALPKCAIGTVKSMIGHLIPAAGIAGMIKAALAVYHNVQPPTLCCDEPNPALELENTPFFINTETRPWVHADPAFPRRAAISSFGFGGINAHAVIEEYRSADDHERISLNSRWDSELFVLEGQDRGELIQQCQKVHALASSLQVGEQAELSDLAYTLNKNLSGRELRLAVVADSLEDLIKKLEISAKRLADPEREQIKDRSGIFFFARPLARGGGRLAFLFPGEGSQYVNMLADLCLHFPEALGCFDLLDQAYADHPRNYLPSQIIFPGNARGRSAAEEKIWRMDGAVDAVSTANRALFKIITSLGIVPDAILGHSSGELAALEASGAVILEREEDVIGHIRTGNRIIEALAAGGSIPEGQLLAVGGVTYETTSRIAAADNDFLRIAMDNCPHQFVLCGTDASVGRAAAELKKAGGICQLLPFRRAYHTERFEPALQLLTGFFENGRFAGPAIPLYSCMTAGLYPETPAEVKEYAVRQWASPVLFRQTIEKMYDDGIRIFLEVGPRANLTGFVNDILSKRPFLAVATNVHHRSGITQLNHALGFLAAHGVEINLEALYRNRSVSPIDLEASAEKQKKSPEKGMKISLALPLLSLKDHGLQIPEQSIPASPPAPTPAVSAPVASRPGAADTGMEEYFRTMEHFLAMQEEVMTAYFSAGAAMTGPGIRDAVQAHLVRQSTLPATDLTGHPPGGNSCLAVTS
ncbi:MAG: type I polyketide synthase [Desulfobulbaceae bacterium]|nr:type I polyketide synthase [Desulfobulbaceae bacterium]